MYIVCPRSSLRIAAVCLLLAFLGGCATGKDPRDPLEPFNRGVYQFNETVDKYVLKPVAQGYQFVLPQPVRTGVGNFFSNINDVTIFANNLLQGKFVPALDDFARIVINTTIGLLGILDVASEAGIPKHEEDFGQTLGVWGVGDGPFIMLPFFGPSNARDTVGRVGDLGTDVLTYVDPTGTRNALWGTRIVDRRAQLLDASKVFDAAALDPYEFLRDAYIQRRRNLIYDGKPPLDKDLDLTPPPAQKKSDAPAPHRTVAAPVMIEDALAASEDHVPAAAQRSPELAPLFAEGQAPSVQRISIVSAAAGRTPERPESAAPAKAPAISAERDSGPSILTRFLRHFDAPTTP